MSSPVYNWRRFWCPRTGRIALDEGSYLSDPEAEHASWFNPDVVPFEKIAGLPCLVLLGEPGIGKSHAMRSERDSTEDATRDSAEEVLWLDLRSIGSEERLCSKLFQDPRFVAWSRGTHTLHVFLDSLDECLLEAKKAALVLVDEVKAFPVARLRLRVKGGVKPWRGAEQKCSAQSYTYPGPSGASSVNFPR